MPFRPRILILPVAAAVIAGLVAFKLTRPPQSFRAGDAVMWQPAPPFKGLDSDNRLVKFERYLGRHEILLIFFDGEAGADHDPLLLRVREQFDSLKRRGTIVVGVSAALPQQNRAAFQRSGAFPFPLLSDPEFKIHQMWGRFDETAERPMTGAFLIDRAGRVAWLGKFPRPEGSLDPLLPNKP